MGLYPSTLFHFTSKDSLYEILNSTFKPSYARESINVGNSVVKIGVPMVSFCDLKLSELRDHIKKYGRYGIGLSKKWAFKMGLNPVLYVNSESEIARSIAYAIDHLILNIDGSSESEIKETLRLIHKNLLNTYRYLKNYEGELERRGNPKNKKYRFAEEREWRFVPSIGALDNNFFVPQIYLNSDLKKAQLNRSIEHLRLTFKPNDIKYLIVPREDDINELIEHIKYVKNQFSIRDIEKLSSRILTSNQIMNDL